MPEWFKKSNPGCICCPTRGIHLRTGQNFTEELELDPTPPPQLQVDVIKNLNTYTSITSDSDMVGHALDIERLIVRIEGSTGWNYRLIRVNSSTSTLLFGESSDMGQQSWTGDVQITGFMNIHYWDQWGLGAVYDAHPATTTTGPELAAFDSNGDWIFPPFVPATSPWAFTCDSSGNLYHVKGAYGFELLRVFKNNVYYADAPDYAAAIFHDGTNIYTSGESIHNSGDYQPGWYKINAGAAPTFVVGMSQLIPDFNNTKPNPYHPQVSEVYSSGFAYYDDARQQLRFAYGPQEHCLLNYEGWPNSLTGVAFRLAPRLCALPL